MTIPPRHTFPLAQHVKRDGDFARIGRTGIRDVRGSLVFHATIAKTAKSRLGIRIGRRCGTAPVRNRIKRLLRESFRLAQHEWTMKLDIVVTVRPHEPTSLGEYGAMLAKAVERITRKIGEQPS